MIKTVYESGIARPVRLDRGGKCERRRTPTPRSGVLRSLNGPWNPKRRFTHPFMTARFIRKLNILLGFLVLGFHTQTSADEIAARLETDLPRPISNNAVSTVTVGAKQYVVSFNGLAAGKTHSDTLNTTYVYDVAKGKWSESTPVPGGVGRLASAAASVGDKAFVFGGYSVAEDGSEVSTAWVHAFDPVAGVFEERAGMPVPVDDMLALAYADRYIYLVSGWHDVGNVNLVQRYDSVEDSWAQATPIPGNGVFGHAGGIVGDTMVYCDGVAIRVNADRRRDFVPNDQCFLGVIDASDARRIDWRTIDAHPGAARYRMASAGLPAQRMILFVGGTDNPYNFNGVGYDGRPSSPIGDALLFDLDTLSWRVVASTAPPSMDHRALAPIGPGWATIGGMLGGQSVTDQVVVYTVE